MKPYPLLFAPLVLAAAMMVLALYPELDLYIARRVYLLEGGSFDVRFDRGLILLRDLGYYLPIVVLTLVWLLWLGGKRNGGPWATPTGWQVAFLTLSLALGPGLLVNGVLKTISHRPRPVQLSDFGGQSAFRPWYAFDGECKTNCSFASGETAGATWLLAPASLLPAPWRVLAMSGASLLALAVALLRVAFGGHFVSDAIGAALVTLATLLAVALALRRGGAAGKL